MQKRKGIEMNLECCEIEPNLVFVYDDPHTGYAFNLYACPYCGTIYKEMVWNNSGLSKCEESKHLNEKVEK